MRITERRVNDVTILELEGRLVLDEGDLPLRDCVNRLVREGYVKIVVDMRKVTLLDSAGIGMLVSKYVSAYLRGGRIKLLCLTIRGERLMEITKLHTVFEIFDTEDEAIRSFARPLAKQLAPPIKAGGPEPITLPRTAESGGQADPPVR